MNPSSLKNYRDLSVRDGPGAGLQYEFYCKCCDFTWKSPKQTLKTARTLGFLSRLSDLAGLLGNANARSLAIKASSATRFATASAGGKAAQAALEEAQAQAVRYFEACVTCGDACCDSCVVDASGQCRRCVEQGKGQTQTPAHGGDGYGGGAAAHGGGGTVCPNCQAAAEGGRFCHECGFDMASTHKSCPTCGSVMSRAARFCTDCGHGF